MKALPAITGGIAAGININITLIFSRKRYSEVMDAYLKGLEQRVAAGLPIDTIASVASFFVSRVDTNIDKRLQNLAQTDLATAKKVEGLYGKAGIANARLAYAEFKKVFTAERFKKLQAHGAQRSASVVGFHQHQEPSLSRRDVHRGVDRQGYG